MPAPYTQEYTMPNGIKLTSVVMDQKDFDAFIDELEKVCLSGFMPNVNKEQIDSVRKTKVLPPMKRGTITEIFFERFNVATEYMSAIVRGQGSAILEAMNERN